MNTKMKYLMYVVICSIAIVVMTGMGSKNVKADYILEDLDGDGKKDTIEWDYYEDYNMCGYYLDYFTVNGEDVYEATDAEEPLFSEFMEFEVYVDDINTKDKYKELVVSTGRESYLYVYRYRKGKIYKPIEVFGRIIGQKKKNVIKVMDCIYVKGLGQFFTEIEYKIKSDKLAVKTKTFKAANGKTETLKSTMQMTIYEDTGLTKKVGTLKVGQKFKAYKYKKDKNGEFSLIYIMNKDGVKGWISTKDIPDYEYIIENPPMWG